MTSEVNIMSLNLRVCMYGKFFSLPGSLFPFLPFIKLVLDIRFWQNLM